MLIQTLFAAEPLELSAIYQKIWISEIVVSADDPAADVVARVRLRRFRSVDGAVEFSPEPAIWLEVTGLLAKAETDAELAGVVSGLMGYVARVGIDRGVIAPSA